MMRKIAVGLAAAVIATGGATLTAAAAHGGGGHGGGGHGGGGHYGGHGGGGHYAYGGHGGGHYMPRGEYGHRYYPEWRHHRYYEPRWGYYQRRYYGGGSCWRNVWTGDGWQRQWVCGYGRPYGESYTTYYRGGWGGHHMHHPGMYHGGRPGGRH